jgi:hypothetical protein
MNQEMKLRFEELLAIAETEEQKMDIGKLMRDMNFNNRNANKIEVFSENIIEKENKKNIRYSKFLTSKSVNGIIFSPTQIGKSKATIEFIKTSFKYNTPVIVSTDNKTDQQDQLVDRIKKDLMGANVILMKVSDKDFKNVLEKCIETGNKRFVIFCLDNTSQIQKLIKEFLGNYLLFSDKMKKIKRISMVHDEADTIAKDFDTETINEDQAKSHKKWLEFKNIINNETQLELKRIFVTATPENIVLLYEIECFDVISLEIPADYTGYDKIEYIDMKDDLDISYYLPKEVERIKNERTYEAILIRVERLIKGQQELLEVYSTELECTINTYNGNGITAFIKPEFKVSFIKELKKINIKYIPFGIFFRMKALSIRDFYTIMKAIGENCIITIGNDLICRGISYVGTDKNEPITASTMFYKPSKKTSCVTMCQTIGRITGTAMPSLKRRLYCPIETSNEYKTFNINQKNYIKRIENDNKNMTTRQIMQETVFKKLNRPIDRPKLALKINMEESDSDTEYETDDNRMTELVDNWYNKETIIGKILKFVYNENNNGVSEKKLKDFIKECGTINVSSQYQEIVKSDRKYNLVFTRKNKKTSLTKDARKYIDEK